MAEQKSVSAARRNKRLKNLYTGMIMKWLDGRKEVDQLMSNVPEVYNDPFATTGAYGEYSIIMPPYDPLRLYRLVEESSILPKCIQAMVDNVPGYGYEYRYVGEGDVPEEAPEKKAMDGITEQANEQQSLNSLRKELRRDLEATGNWYAEVLRYPDEKVALMYRARAAYVRITAQDKQVVPVEVLLRRNGEVRTTIIYKRFRRFAYLSNDGTKIKWFKEYGDPRPMSYMTGEYVKTTKYPATEILHHKIDCGISSYGMPRWIGNVMNVMGVKSADFVNYDLFKNQGIPPLIVLVSGGQLTEGSIDELEDLFVGLKGVENFNKLAILEAEDMTGEIDSQNRARIDIKELYAARKDDLMFDKYIISSDGRVRQSFRLPPIFTGNAEEYTFATAKTSRLIAEEQVFKPERQLEDEMLSASIFAEYPEWKIVTKGPEVIRSDEIANMFQHMTNAGALNINSAIDLANRMFDLKLKPYTEEWAEVPLVIVNQLAKIGRLAVPEGILTDELTNPMTGGPKDGGGPMVPEMDEKHVQFYLAMKKLKQLAPHFVASVEAPTNDNEGHALQIS